MEREISEADYETARLNYEQSITKALNDVDTNFTSPTHKHKVPLLTYKNTQL